MDEALKLAEQIFQGPAAIDSAKKVINIALDLDIKSGIDLSSELYAKAHHPKDAKEGIRAYLEKRKPRFEGY